jgi:S-adenosylmethionine hydrolase
MFKMEQIVSIAVVHCDDFGNLIVNLSMHHFFIMMLGPLLQEKICIYTTPNFDPSINFKIDYFKRSHLAKFRGFRP